MPRYHFDTESGGSRYHDREGIELATLDQARQQLAALMRDMTYGTSAESVDVTVRADVTCDDVVVLRGTCTVKIDAPSQESAAVRELLA